MAMIFICRHLKRLRIAADKVELSEPSLQIQCPDKKVTCHVGEQLHDTLFVVEMAPTELPQSIINAEGRADVAQFLDVKKSVGNVDRNALIQPFRIWPVAH